MARRVLPPDLDADLGRMLVEVGDQNLADQTVEVDSSSSTAFSFEAKGPTMP